MPTESNPPRWETQRQRMLQEQLIPRGIEDAAVLEVMGRVPRQLFLPEPQRPLAYEDRALPLGCGQTLSQPFVVAAMTQLLRLRGKERVLEVGTGSGYQTAVLGGIASEVYTVELLPALSRDAARLLKHLGFENLYFRQGDGALGWPEKAPFDRIMVTAAPQNLPPALIEQLNVGGCLVLPLGKRKEQELILYEKTSQGLVKKKIFPVRFVPLVSGQEE